MERVKRGPYKKYLKDPSCAVPKTSWWRVRQRSRIAARKCPLEPIHSGEVCCPVEDFDGSLQGVSENNRDFVDEVQLDGDDTSSPIEALSSSSDADISSHMEVLSSCDSDNSDHGDNQPDSLYDHDSDLEASMDSLDSSSGCTTFEHDQTELPSFDFNDPKFKTLFKPIYKDASITLCGAFCAIMEFKRACRLPFTAIEKLLKLLQLLCPSDNMLPQTTYEVKKFFGHASCCAEKHKFCADCDLKLREDQKFCDKSTCRKKEPSTLIKLDPVKSIKRVLTRNWKDVSPGTCGVTFNTDGVSPFKSSHLTVWPIIIALSVLPPKVRWNKDNLIVVSFWVGMKKPPMDILFSPLLDTLNTLSTVGLTLSTPAGMNKSFTFEPLFGSFDFVAKAPILNMHQFNGKYGCPSCLNPGVRTASQYYLPDNQYGLRSNESVIKDAEEAESKGKVINGIKGRSVLSGVVDLVQGVPLDYMHCVLEGVVKWLLERWVNSTNHGHPYYIGTTVRAVDSLLLDQRPPHEFSRAPRSVEKSRKHWKASEFRNWLLYYSLPLLLFSKLPPLYFHHFSLLVCAMHILLKSKISDSQILAAEELLKEFYLMLPNLYGINSCTLNAHSLIHLGMYVRRWGPLWTHSLFGYENLNGYLTNMIHSRNKVAEQLSFSLDVCQTIGNLADKLIELEDATTIDFISPMSSIIHRHTNMMCVLPGVYSMGKVQFLDFTEEERRALQDITNIPVQEIHTFHKLYFKDTIFHSHQCDTGKRNSSICGYVLKGEKGIGVVQKFCFSPPIVLVKPFKKTESSILRRNGNPGRERLRKYASIDLISCFIVEVHNQLLPVCAIHISDLVSKCVHISLTPHSYVIHIPNNYEHH